jgi:hypothetical protein
MLGLRSGPEGSHDVVIVFLVVAEPLASTLPLPGSFVMVLTWLFGISQKYMLAFSSFASRRSGIAC